MANVKKAEEFKLQGNKEYSAGKYTEAVSSYSKAIDNDPNNHLYYSNRSAAYAGLSKWEQARDDAAKCISLKKDWAKGYFRKGLAEYELKKYDECIKTMNEGLAHDPSNTDLRDKKREAERMWQTHKPRVNPDGTPMSEAISLKEDGNLLFRSGKYEQAIEVYTKAILKIKPVDTPEQQASIYNNRAACYKELYHYNDVIKDSSESLKLMPNNNTKALIRRGLAYEANERMQHALDDLRQALLLDPSAKVAQDAINRINNALRRQKQQ
eukprot:TRINITY_DN193_c0_g1_i1.p1 TRINITY_DN193_c0_g1~~TRINITY_DN193_c0_g1_i1.p1  ORF type:complete len:268 (+),score=88.73 TRINITY_DN193_c0_g1_i1:61-864(+)